MIGDSGIFVPLSDLGAIIEGTEVTVRSPRLFKVAQLRAAYSNSIGQGVGPITGGLFEPLPPGNFLLDHDPAEYRVGSFVSHFAAQFLGLLRPTSTDPDSSREMAPDTCRRILTFDLSVGQSIGESWSFSLNATNLANYRYLQDTSNTFGGTHYNYPRVIYFQLRYRFHF